MTHVRPPVFYLLLACILPVNAPAVQTSQSPRIYLVQDISYPAVAFTMILENAGFLKDPIGQEGKTVLSLFILLRYMQLNYASLKNEGVLSFYAQEDDKHISLTVLTQKNQLKSAMRAVFKTLYSVALSYPEWRAQKASIKQSFLDPEFSPADQFLSYKWAAIHYPDHPLGKRYGTAESLDAINPKDTEHFWKERMRRNSLIFMVAGDVHVHEIRSILSPLLHHIQEGTLEEENVSDITYPQETPSLQVFQLDKPQSILLFGHRGVEKDHPDYYAYKVLSYIVGGSRFTSRLWKSLREEHGLVYNVTANTNDMLKSFFGFLEIDNERTALAAEKVQQTIEDILKNGVTKEEIEGAKTQLIGKALLPMVSLEGTTNSMYAAFYNKIPIDEFITYEPNKIKQVTAEAVNRLSQELLKPDSLKYLIVGNPNLSYRTI